MKTLFYKYLIHINIIVFVVLLGLSLTSCNYLVKMDWTIPDYTVYRDRQIVNNPSDSTMIYMLMHKKITPFHYRKYIYQYNIEDTIAKVVVDTTFGEIECLQSKINGDIVFSGVA